MGGKKKGGKTGVIQTKRFIRIEKSLSKKRGIKISFDGDGIQPVYTHEFNWKAEKATLIREGK